ncbi:expressed unknown protein [Seminavis robusta]|uniref:Uncharacterized protein n=1 Tax=Seminavis robusta TaxID=568900 RepID=A0A9N8ECF8_9STRA|nr:expressed unknown protein [Seminavis robusta]|eukprot:Sro887_g216280.1 n/a (342) ;mRNA; f:11381-12474
MSGYSNQEDTPKKPLRAGMWTQEEMVYVNALVKEFRDGALDLSQGMTLRRFLAERLHCHPKRISKKYEGTGLNGRTGYVGQTYTPVELNERKIRLELLRGQFLESVENLDLYHGGNIPRAAAAQRDAAQRDAAASSGIRNSLVTTQIGVNSGTAARNSQLSTVSGSTAQYLQARARLAQATLGCADLVLSGVVNPNPMGSVRGSFLQDVYSRPGLGLFPPQINSMASAPSGLLSSALGASLGATDSLALSLGATHPSSFLLGGNRFGSLQSRLSPFHGSLASSALGLPTRGTAVDSNREQLMTSFLSNRPAAGGGSGSDATSLLALSNISSSPPSAYPHTG